MVTVTLGSVEAKLGARAVVREVSARLEPGALVGIIGPNGAGKSTLVRLMLGLVDPSKGEVRIDDVAIGTLSRRVLAQRLAYLPQGQTLHWPLTVERLVGLGRMPHLGPMSRMTAADAAAITQAMARAEVTALSSRVATELSGGERARVMLARALAVGAPGLIVDEPLAALDPGHQIDVMELLRREARGGKLVVAVLHDLTMAARYCDRLLVMDEGRLVADGEPDAVLSAKLLADVYGIAAARHDGAIVPLKRIDAAVQQI